MSDYLCPHCGQQVIHDQSFNEAGTRIHRDRCPTFEWSTGWAEEGVPAKTAGTFFQSVSGATYDPPNAASMGGVSGTGTVGPQGPPGPAGPQGPEGPKGDPGQLVRRWWGFGAPGTIIGAAPGDEYVDVQSGDLYRLT